MDLKSILKELETPPVVVTSTNNIKLADIEKLASLMENQDNAVVKKFAEGVNLIASDLQALEEKRSVAEKVAMQLIKTGRLEPNNIFTKVAELMTQPTEELRITDKALEMSKFGSFQLGSLSTEQDLSPTSDYKTASSALEHIMSRVKGE